MDNVTSFPRAALAPTKPRRARFTPGCVAVLAVLAFAFGIALGVLA